MKQIGPGVLPQSRIFFSSVSLRAARMYYNAVCAGHFFCGEDYHLVRDGYDSMLLLYVAKGSFTFRNSSGDYETVFKDTFVVLDCYSYHEYFTKDNVEFYWVHIAGQNSRELCGEIIKNYGNAIKSNMNLSDKLKQLVESLSADEFTAENEISLKVYELLMELINPISPLRNEKGIYNENISRVKEYICEHMNEKLTVSLLASVVNMSPTYFSSVFRQITGFSPYDYVLSMRMNKAKELLLKTDMSIAQVAYETGFGSQANFVYRFSSTEGISPGRFRKNRF